MADRYSVPTHLDTPDGIGSYTIRQGLILIGTVMFVVPATYITVPQAGPALGDAVRAALPTLGQVMPAGAFPLLPTVSSLVPLAFAGALALPFEPPVEHGAIAWMRYRSRPRILGPQLIDDLLGHPTIEQGVARLHGDYVACWSMPSVSMRLASDAARNVERARWAAFLDSAPCPVQTSVRTRPVDLEQAFRTMADSPNPNGRLLAGHLRAAATAGGEVQRQRLLWIRASTEDQLQRWALDIDGALARAGFGSARLYDDDLADVLQLAWSRKRKGRRIGPNVIRVEADGIQVDGEWITTLALQRWPASVSMDFMAALYDGSDSIDVHQIIQPIETEKVRKQLEDQQFKLTTTQVTRERRVAVEQIESTLEALEHHHERVYDTTILFAVRAPTREALQARRRRVEVICSEMGALAAALRWEHPDGAVACAGGLENRLIKRSHRVDTSSITRAFPLGASELGLDGGIPWGKTLYGNRRVVWSPFARPLIANPQTAVYAGSGGGKGFAIKVATSRGLLAGMFEECFALDQAEEERDGEYGKWARYCGGEIRRVEGESWEQDLARALADIPAGPLPPALVLNVAGLSREQRCHALVAFKAAIFARIAEIRKRRAFVIDEMWSFDEDRAAEFAIEDTVRRGRHFGLAGFYATQRVLDALNSKTGAIVQSLCATQWYGMQGNSEIADVAKKLRWTNEQLETIERFTAGQAMLIAGRDRLVFYVDHTPEEYEAFNTDYTILKPKGRSPDHARSDYVPALAVEPTGRPIAGRSDSGTDRSTSALAGGSRLNGAA